MSRKEFSLLLKQYLAGECSEQEKLFVEHWFGLLQNEENKPMEIADLEQMEPLLWEKISNQTDIQTQRGTPHFITWRRIAGVAAALLIAVVSFQVYTWFGHEETLAARLDVPYNPEIWVTKVNQSEKPLRVDLPDQSVAVIQPGSRLEYPGQFDTEARVVLLSGEAFFEVQKMNGLPFLVHAGNLTTKVLGTSFVVRTQPDKNISVEVLSGSVAVFERKTKSNTSDLKELVLKPNHRALYNEENHELVAGIVEKPQALFLPDKENNAPSFNYSETPLSTILSQLEDTYGISIELENERQKSCPLTADLSELTLFEQLDFICAATNSNYSSQGTTIRISGEGCAHIAISNNLNN